MASHRTTRGHWSSSTWPRNKATTMVRTTWEGAIRCFMPVIRAVSSLNHADFFFVSMDGVWRSISQPRSTTINKPQTKETHAPKETSRFVTWYLLPLPLCALCLGKMMVNSMGEGSPPMQQRRLGCFNSPRIRGSHWPSMTLHAATRCYSTSPDCVEVVSYMYRAGKGYPETIKRPPLSIAEPRRRARV